MREKLVVIPSRNAPAGDEAGEGDADAEHHGDPEEDCPQPTATDVLCRQPDQQPTIMPAWRHLAPRKESNLFSEENVPGLVDLRDEVMRAAAFGNDFLLEAAVRFPDLLWRRRRIEPEDVERFL
jgi:hypothetical protein